MIGVVVCGEAVRLQQRDGGGDGDAAHRKRDRGEE